LFTDQELPIVTSEEMATSPKSRRVRQSGQRKNKLHDDHYVITNANQDLNWSLIFCIYVNDEMVVDEHVYRLMLSFNGFHFCELDEIYREKYFNRVI
jgi:hypothetical protein